MQDAESMFKTKPSEEAGEQLRQVQSMKDHQDDDAHHDIDDDIDDDDDPLHQVGRRLVELVDDATTSGFTRFNQPVFIFFMIFFWPF